MKRDLLTLVVSLSLFALTACEGPSTENEKKEKEVATDVKFACAQHGPLHMSLTLSREEKSGDDNARRIEIVGGRDVTRWVVTIDGKEPQPPVPDGGTVKVRPGDTITWSVAQRKHGVVFAEQDRAQALLEFDVMAGKKLKDQMLLAKNDPSWKAFGSKLWGADATSDVGVLATCKVK